MISATLLLTSAFAAGLPAVNAQWSGELGRVLVIAPPGEHLNAEAPATVWLSVDGRSLETSGFGADLAAGAPFVLSGKGAHALSGAAQVSLCEDGGSTCRTVSVAFDGQLTRRKGSLALATRESHGAPGHGESAPTVPVEEVFEAARLSGGLVLLDFSAVWCPPCNLMASEVLHDPENASDLTGFSLAMLDVDRQESWALKSRYKVGGYPTLIATRPDGTEIDRLVGYPGEAEMLQWIQRVQGDLLPLDSLESSSLSGAEAGVAALRLARAEHDGAAAVLARADDGVDAHIARLLLEPKVEDAAWLVEHAPERIDDWAYYAMDLALPADVAARFGAVLDAAIAGSDPVRAADLLYARASLAPEGQRASFYAAAAALLHAGLSGDPARDRGHYTYLAELYEESGHPELALALLNDAIAAFPDEFTFHYAAAGLLLNQQRFEEALPFAEAAESLSYGDNKLRAVERHARVLLGLGRQEDALRLVDATLNSAERPPEGVTVRTTRYLANLEKLRKELGGS